ncbi:sensor histidine kinase [Fodinicola acaciae]|uniref:sensor histidine kinase n=1 Tax=Fodinicola acaciae TaxID=2681555 RepID=UPI0013D3ECF5|nr:HAMP domain-containing sensor histidine kinase [Fodinicola acaciae]
MSHRLTLRGRLALMSAGAVAIAIALAAIAGWLVTYVQLYQQFDGTLKQTAKSFSPVGDLRQFCLPQQAKLWSNTIRIQVVDARGFGICGQASYLPQIRASDLAIAGRETDQTYAFRDETLPNGSHLRVLTVQITNAPEAALMIAQPLDDIDSALRALAFLYAGIAALGILLAASSGLVIARASLAPVDRLTQAAEHIARTEDLSVKLPIEGDDEIARLGEAFNTMTGALAVSRERQRRLIEDAGHELRTPLTSLRTNVDLLLRSAATGRPLPEGEAPRMLTSIDAQLRELSDLVIDVLALARGDEAAVDGVKREVALHKVVERALGRARLRGPDHEITATTEPWYVVGNPASMERAVLNILDNAIKFSPPAGAIEVVLRNGKLTVRDHGPGISTEDATAVFERFWRSPTARALPGSGLGLAIVAQVMREIGGTVTLAAAAGGGAIATCVFPGSPSETSAEPVGPPVPQPH